MVLIIFACVIILEILIKLTSNQTCSNNSVEIITTSFHYVIIYLSTPSVLHLCIETVALVQWVSQPKSTKFAMCAAIGDQTQSSQSSSQVGSFPRAATSPNAPATQLQRNDTQKSNSSEQSNNITEDPSDYEELFDEFMNMNNRKVMFNRRSGRILITENDEPVSEIQRDGIYDENFQRIPFQRLDFESIDYQKAWVLTICNDLLGDEVSSSSSTEPARNFDAYITHKQLVDAGNSIDNAMTALKRRRLTFDEENELQSQIPVSNPQFHNLSQLISPPQQNSVIRHETLNLPPRPVRIIPCFNASAQNNLQASFQQQFNDEFKKYAEYESKQEQEAAVKLRQMLEGICRMEFKNFDAKSVLISPMERQILLNKVYWKHANKLWKILYIAPLSYGERLQIVRNSVQSSSAIQHLFLDLLLSIGIENTEKLMDKLVDGYRLALVASSEAQQVREQLAGGVFERLDKVEIYSETTKAKMVENSKIRKQNFRFPRFSSHNNLVWVNQRSRQADTNQIRRKGQGQLKGNGFKRWNSFKKSSNMDKDPNMQQMEDPEKRI
ncbi:MAG: hypothetical protein EZS28_003260 [Streblomastix strix]|uniref:Uncharacterized protein n=1 Tax=Streblomastix strix TaxID=222440 RepID=A0A5J4X384_9EUKA|nr:MAG: hypothetical protein EZS28_003260 [Streblomastix strix]